jgi:hypothetical protein
MMAHGFNSELLVDLCIAGLAIAKVERMIAGERTVEVVRPRVQGSNLFGRPIPALHCRTPAARAPP